MTPAFSDDERDCDGPKPTTLGDLRGALDAVARVLAVNEPRHRGRWRQQTARDHVRHAAAHLEAWQTASVNAPVAALGDLAHAATRCLMSLELALGASGRTSATRPESDGSPDGASGTVP